MKIKKIFSCFFSLRAYLTANTFNHKNADHHLSLLVTMEAKL